MKRNVMTVAHKIRREENVSMSAALRKAWALEKLAVRIHALRGEIHPGGFIQIATKWGGQHDPMAAKRAELDEMMAQFAKLWGTKAEEIAAPKVA